MRIRTVVLTLFFLCVGTVGVHGQETLTSRQKAAAELLDLLHVQENTHASIQTMIDGMISQNPALGDVRDVLVDFMDKYMTWDKLRPEYIRMYAQAFTEPELHQMIAFYKTPTGQKTVKMMPQLFRQGAELGQRLIQPHIPELRQMIMERMRARSAPADTDTIPPASGS